MRVRWPVIFILVLAFVLAIAAGSTMMWRLLFFILVLAGVGYLWVRRLIPQIDGRLDKKARFYRVGEYFEGTFTLTNRGPLPVFLLEAAEKTELSGPGNSIRIPLPSGGLYTWPARHLCQRRGQYQVGRLKAKIYDPLDLFYIPFNLVEIENLYVLPRVIDLPYFQVLPRPEPGVNMRRWFAGEPGHNASRVREYSSGDSLRHIHWHSTAHTGSLMVKEYDPDLSRAFYFTDIWIILDLHQDTDLGEGDQTMAEYGLTIAASLIKKYLDRKKKVGFLVCGDRPHLFPPNTGILHEQKINETIASVQPSGKVALENLITSQEERIATSGAVIVITPADHYRIGPPLRRLSNRGSAVTAILIDAVSFGGKTSAADTSRALASVRVNVYTFKLGMDISQALDVRHLSSPSQYTGGLRES